MCVSGISCLPVHVQPERWQGIQPDPSHAGQRDRQYLLIGLWWSHLAPAAGQGPQDGSTTTQMEILQQKTDVHQQKVVLFGFMALLIQSITMIG